MNVIPTMRPHVALNTIQLSSICTIYTLILVRDTMAHPLLSDYSLTKAIVNVGDIAMFSGVYEKLDRGECLNVAAIGGSVTVGWHVEQPFQFNGTWAQHLIRLLDIEYPCKIDANNTGSHNLTVIARGATPSVIWIDILTGDQENTLKGFDLVFVETSMNDANEPKQAKAVQSFTEVLMALVLQQTARVASKRDENCSKDYQRAWTGTAAIWLATSSRPSVVQWNDPSIRRTVDAAPVQVPVAHHHGVPYISIVDALGPFRTAASKDWMTSHFFFDEHGHPSELGHKMLASAVMDFVRIQHKHLALQAPWADLTSVPYCPKPPYYNSKTTLDTYLDGSKFMLSFSNNTLAARNATQCADWSVFEDVPKKPGLISSTVGASCDIFVRPEELGQSSTGLVHINAFKSYENFGMLGIYIESGPAVNGGCRTSNNRTRLNETTFDGIWKSRTTQAQRSELQYTLPKSTSQLCLYIRVKIEEAGRDGNKAKLHSILIIRL